MQKLALISLALSTIVAPWTGVDPTPGEREERQQALAARCLFEDPAFRLENVAPGDLERVLEHHARCHGWNVGDQDVVVASRFVTPAPCRGDALEALRARVGSFGDGRDALDDHVLVALAHNGFESDALAALRRSIAGATDRRGAARRSRFGAHLAIAVGRFEDAIALSESPWGPVPTCGLGAWSDAIERESVRSKALAALGRLLDEPIDLSAWPGRFELAEFQLRWLFAATSGLEPDVARGRAAELAEVRFPRVFRPVVLEQFSLLHTPPARVTAREVGLLARYDPDHVRRRIAAASSDERHEVCAGLFADEPPPDAGAGIGILLALGVPELEPFVDRPWSSNENEIQAAKRRASYDRARAIWGVFADEWTPAEALALRGNSR